MDIGEAAVLVEIFRQQAAVKRHETELALAYDRRDDDRKKHALREREEKDERERLEQLVVEATAAQVAAFQDTLDGYDTATVRALMDNQNALDAVRDRREAMETAAHRLPDGRIVFKTEDGKRVFDRDGVQLSHDLVHPDAVPDSAPRWEAIKALRDSENGLLRDRDKLDEFQHRLNETREAVDKGHVSADALARMDADLKKAMPDSVREQLPGASYDPAVPNVRETPFPGAYSSSRQTERFGPRGP